MNASDELRYDHDVLRAKLCLLELYLPSYRDCACTVSRLIDSFASCLRSHTEREERLLTVLALACGEPSQVCLERVHDAHENQRTQLAILHGLLSQPEPGEEGQVVVQFAYLAHNVREHLATEEQDLFPLIDLAGLDELVMVHEAVSWETP